MYRVIVLGGLSLVGSTSCANSVGPDGGGDVAQDSLTDVAPDFPRELPVFIDAGHVDATDDCAPHHAQIGDITSMATSAREAVASENILETGAFI